MSGKIWMDPNEQIEEAPSDVRPKKLLSFVDWWIQGFTYDGDFSPAATFRCDKRLTDWGLSWKHVPGEVPIVIPLLSCDGRGHPQIGLNVIEIQALDKETILMVVEEKLPNAVEQLTYALILDLIKLSDEKLKDLNTLGHMLPPQRGWTTKVLIDQFKWVEEERIDRGGIVPGTNNALSSTTKPKTVRKRKSTVGAPGDRPEAPLKKAKSEETKLTVQGCVTMVAADIEKLSTTKMKEMKSIYNDHFSGLYKWGTKPLIDAQGATIMVDYKNLHKAPAGVIVYRGIQKDRLASITNMIRIQSKFHASERIITVLPLQRGPYGPNQVVQFSEKCPSKASMKKDTDFYIIGGQHTVEAHKNLLEANEIPESEKAEASRFSIIPVWAHKDDFMKLMLLSRVLNQDIAGPQKEESFTKQLMHARMKWAEMGKPQPAMHGRHHSKEYNDFIPALASIFTNVKPTDLMETKIPLLFVDDDQLVQKWMHFEELYLNGELMDATGGYPEKKKLKPLVQNDYKTLYGLRKEDISYLANLVENAEVCLKASKTKMGDKHQILPSLAEAGAKERLIRAMKNELMFYFENHELPSKKSSYTPYSVEAWDQFALEMKIGRTEISHWVDKALISAAGKQWLDGRVRPLNKTTNPKDCPESMKNMWDNHIHSVHESDIADDMRTSFTENYLCQAMDPNHWDMTEVVSREEVTRWRGIGKQHIYFWFLFKSTLNSTCAAEILEDRKLQRLFDALECLDMGNLVVRSPAVLFTDCEGFFQVLTHLEKRRRVGKKRIWTCHAVQYVTNGDDGFPRPRIGPSYVVYVLLCFGFSIDENPQQTFKAFFPGKIPMAPVFISNEIEETIKQWKRPGIPSIKVAALQMIFQEHINQGSVIVNVNGGPHFSYLGFTSEAMVLDVVYSDQEKERAKMSANEIWTILYSERVQTSLSAQEEDLTGVLGNKEDVISTEDDTDAENEDQEEKFDDHNCEILDQQDMRQDSAEKTNEPVIIEGPTIKVLMDAVIEKEPVCEEVSVSQKALNLVNAKRAKEIDSTLVVYNKNDETGTGPSVAEQPNDLEGTLLSSQKEVVDNDSLDQSDLREESMGDLPVNNKESTIVEANQTSDSLLKFTTNEDIENEFLQLEGPDIDTKSTSDSQDLKKQNDKFAVDDDLTEAILFDKQNEAALNDATVLDSTTLIQCTSENFPMIEENPSDDQFYRNKDTINIEPLNTELMKDTLQDLPSFSPERAQFEKDTTSQSCTSGGVLLENTNMAIDQELNEDEVFPLARERRTKDNQDTFKKPNSKGQQRCVSTKQMPQKKQPDRKAKPKKFIGQANSSWQGLPIVPSKMATVDKVDKNLRLEGVIDARDGKNKVKGGTHEKKAIPEDLSLRSGSTYTLKKVPNRRYSVVLDLNGVLVYRGPFVSGVSRTIKLRPGCKEFLEWLRTMADVSFWSSVNDKNMGEVLSVVLQATLFKLSNILVLTQGSCDKSSHINLQNPKKPFFLKDLKKFVELAKLNSMDNVLLVDDTPLKNLLNKPYSAVHPSSWSGDESDTFLEKNLRPWLHGLFDSNQVVCEYVKANPLIGGSLPEEKFSTLALNILQGLL